MLGDACVTDVPFTAGELSRVSACEAERQVVRERAWGTQTIRSDARGDPMPCFGDDDYALAYLAGGWPAVRAVQAARGDPSATVCATCAHRHDPVWQPGGYAPSPVAQARRELWAARRIAVLRVAQRLVSNLSADRYGRARVPPTFSSRAAAALARWLVPLVDGRMPVRVCDECGSREGVDFYDKPTAYVACDGREDPDANDGGVLCAGCRESAREHWRDMWALARS